jgi:hypothetical protein
VAIVGVAGLLVGAGIGIAANVRTTTVTAQHTTTTVGAAQAPGQAETHAGTHAGTNAGTHTVTRTVTQTVARTTAEPSRNVGNLGAPPTTFSGNGPKHIGTLTLPRTSAISWHASGGHLFIGNVSEPGSGDLLEFSEKGTSGKTSIAKGTYRNLEVIASGEWGFTLTPEP